ncbi:class I lanthipeptide [Taibaiella koreensis]|uniref:class I lanthipeptide n=1 Tax=Taibaiella koreensis TaxID=1268548 RepID=UPI000E59E45B|nr:class I lanthipeptide [Taibaiella koreensis]
MKKKQHPRKLSLQKIAIVCLDQQQQTALLGGATANTTCCGTLPGQRQTTCCSLASCPPYIC